MVAEKYDPKIELDVLRIVSDFLDRFREFRSPPDVSNWFGNDCIVDVTDTPERDSLKSIRRLPEDFLERAFQFLESKKRRGIIEVAFHKSKLVNVRVTAYAYGWFPASSASKLLLDKIHPLVANTAGPHFSPVRRVVQGYTFFGFNWSDFKGLNIGIHTCPKAATTTVLITDRDYLQHF
jgi:hypothetical protein